MTEYLRNVFLLPSISLQMSPEAHANASKHTCQEVFHCRHVRFYLPCWVKDSFVDDQQQQKLNEKQNRIPKQKFIMLIPFIPQENGSATAKSVSAIVLMYVQWRKAPLECSEKDFTLWRGEVKISIVALVRIFRIDFPDTAVP